MAKFLKKEQKVNKYLRLLISTSHLFKKFGITSMPMRFLIVIQCIIYSLVYTNNIYYIPPIEHG